MARTVAEQLRLENTRQAASAFLQDIEHIREVVAQQASDLGAVRRLSAPLRRLLVNRELALVAAPRIGKVLLRTHSLTWAYKTPTPVKLFLFFAGEVTIFGQYFGSFSLNSIPEEIAPKPITMPAIEGLVAPDGYVGAEVSLSLELFLQQKIICLMGHWVSRQSTVKYVANIASGVHSDTPSHANDVTLGRVRNAISVSKGPKAPHIHINWEKEDPIKSAQFKPSGNTIDPVLIEILSTAKILSESPDVIKLEELVRSELNQIALMPK